MKKENEKQVEEFLEGFSFKPAPSMLKEKILNTALKRQKTNHVMTEFLWKGLAGCLLVLIFVIFIDATITHTQNKRFASILHKQQESIDITEEEHSIIREIIMDFTDSTKSEANVKFYDFLKKQKKIRRQLERRKFLEEELK